MSNVNRDIVNQISNEEGFGEIPLQEIGDPDGMPHAQEFANEYQVNQEGQYDMNGNQQPEYQDQDEMRVQGEDNMDEDGAYIGDDMHPGPACQAHYDHPDMGMSDAQQRDPRQYAYLPPCFT
tara:strand:+ start:997 stop:1362 length:366 start_codon:yes stop_codon:yes gene_type:complete